MGWFSFLNDIPVVGDVINTAGSFFGGERANASAKQIAQNNNATAIELANTAHQREIKDLKAAGLNPILSAGGNGAASPTMQGYDVQNSVGQAVSTALQYKRLRADLENLEADTRQKDQAAELSRKQQRFTERQTKLLDTQESKMAEETQKIVADYYLADAQRKLTQANTSSALSIARMTELDAQSAEQLGVLFKQLQAAGGSAKTAAEIGKILHSMSKETPSYRRY